MAGQSPTLRRKELGARLRQLRIDAGLTAEEVADRLLCSSAKISRIETGGRGVSLRDVRDLSGIYGVDAREQEHLMSLAKESKQRAWWQEYDLKYQTYYGLEAAAASIADYESGMVPGLLHTEAYARAMAAGTDPAMSPEEREHAIQARLKRQNRLTEPSPPRFHALIDESALRRMVGGLDVMREQLSVLVERAVLPNVTLQIVPFDAGAHPGIDSTFTILGFAENDMHDVVYVEGLMGQFYLERPTDIERYHRVFGEIAAKALDPESSVARIEAIGGAYA
jgi:transcriptional regulator with XRE-family HTH domain